jgi:hypothetical protein
MKKHRVANWAKKEDPTIFCLLDSPYWLKEALAASERLEEDLLSQWPPKTGRGSNTYLGQSRLQIYIDQMR